jgi:hypothetical protein
VFAAVIAAGEAGGSTVSPYVFGGFTLVVMLALLGITLLIKVER